MSQNRQDRLLESLLSLPGNTTCADCKSPAPRWASVNLGIFICVQCASIHRGLGTHTSRVKSVTMDTWTREMVDRMREVGNTKANATWNPDERRHPPPVSTAEFGERQGEMERFIRDKYEAGLFRADRSTGREAPTRPAEPPLRGKPEPRRTDSWNTLGIPEARDTKRWDAEERAATYGYNGHGGGMAASGSSGTKRAATRAHVDSNWAEFMASEARPSSGGEGRKAGRLLGVGEGYDGEVRLPPVTKAPKGLVYKREETGPREVETKATAIKAPLKRTPSVPPVQSPTPTPAIAPLVDLDATVPMQRSFPQPQQPPLASPLPLTNPTNPFLQPQPFQQHLNPSIHTGGYLSASTTPLQAPFHNPLMPQTQQGFYTPGPATTMGTGGYFGEQQQGIGFAQPFGGQAFAPGHKMPQGYAYGGWGR